MIKTAIAIVLRPYTGRKTGVNVNETRTRASVPDQSDTNQTDLHQLIRLPLTPGFSQVRRTELPPRSRFNGFSPGRATEASRQKVIGMFCVHNTGLKIRVKETATPCLCANRLGSTTL